MRVLLGEVAPEPLERLVLLLGVLTRDAVAPTHVLQRREHRLVGDAEAAEQIADSADDLRHREQQVLGREVVVAEVDALRVSTFEHPVRVGRQLRLRGLPVDLGKAAQCFLGAVAHDLGRDPESLQHREDHALRLRHQRGQEVLGRDLRVVVVARERLRGAERLSGLPGELVGIDRHARTSGSENLPKLTT